MGRYRPRSGSFGRNRAVVDLSEIAKYLERVSKIGVDQPGYS